MGPENKMCAWVQGHEGDPNCQHGFKTNIANVLTRPVMIHLECIRCGRRECRMDMPGRDTVDMVFYGPVTVSAPKSMRG